MAFFISIFLGETVNPIFSKANREILISFKVQLDQIQNIKEKQRFLESVWNKKFRASLLNLNSKDGPWDTISFSNHSDMSLFLLKWA